MGAVEILIVWENLEITRYVLKNHQSDGKFAHTKISMQIEIARNKNNTTPDYRMFIVSCRGEDLVP